MDGLPREEPLLVDTPRGLVVVGLSVDDDAPDGPDDPPIFASKTAATRAGLGWIGKTALLVTPEWGPAVRLGTVFTYAALGAGERSGTGSFAGC